jgi:hypothetical protein
MYVNCVGMARKKMATAYNVYIIIQSELCSSQDPNPIPEWLYEFTKMHRTINKLHKLT